MFSVANIGPVLSDEARYFGSGRVISDGHAVCKLRGYAFDCASVRTFYSRDNVWGGMISVHGDHVSITFQETADSFFAPPRFVQEDLEAGVEGMREVSHEFVSDYPSGVRQGKK